VGRVQMTPTGTMCFRRHDHGCRAAIAMMGLKLRAVSRVGEVAEVICQKGGEPGRTSPAARVFEQKMSFRLPRSGACLRQPRWPTPVGVSTPPRPQPPARMRSTKVPWGTRSTSTWLASICCCTFGLRPIWVAVRRETRVASNSLPNALFRVSPRRGRSAKGRSSAAERLRRAGAPVFRHP